MEGKIFVEKAWYITPPKLPDTATKEEVKKAWVNWVVANAKKRASHKQQWTKAQKHGSLSDLSSANTMVKIQGVWKQQIGMVGLAGDVGSGTLETVLTELPKQGRHHRFRGKRKNKSGNKHKKARLKRKELKRQMILNKVR